MEKKKNMNAETNTVIIPGIFGNNLAAGINMTLAPDTKTLAKRGTCVCVRGVRVLLFENVKVF